MQDFFRERRPVIWRVQIFPDDNNPIGVTAPYQTLDGSHAGYPRPDYYRRAHRLSLVARPMTAERLAREVAGYCCLPPLQSGDLPDVS